MLWKFPQVIYIVHEHKNTQKYIVEFFKASESYKNALFRTTHALGTLKYVTCLIIKALTLIYKLSMAKKHQKMKFKRKIQKKEKKNTEKKYSF